MTESLRRNKGSAVCHANSIRADEAESLVKEKLLRTLSLNDFGDSVIQQMKQTRDERLESLKREQEANSVKQETLKQNIVK
ncbi:hypothetical protein [Furfurilactobacillus cerevisiae]